MINIMINIMYVKRYAPCAYTLANAWFFNVFYCFSKSVLGDLQKKTLDFWPKPHEVFTIFVIKFALHDVKLLRQNGQWGGERGRGDLMYI